MTPLTTEQAGIWFTEELGRTAATTYHLALTVDFHGPLDPDRLTAAWSTVVGRHPGLAAAVRVLDGLPFLMTAPAPTLLVMDIEPTDVDRLTEEQISRPFDRATGHWPEPRSCGPGPSNTGSSWWPIISCSTARPRTFCWPISLRPTAARTRPRARTSRARPSRTKGRPGPTGRDVGRNRDCSNCPETDHRPARMRCRGRDPAQLT